MDSKQSLGHQLRPVVVETSRSRRASRWLGLAALGVLALTFGHVLPIRSSGPDDTTDDPRNIWEEILPSASLSWTPCYDGMECAKLSVPLDYSDPSGPRAAIALTQLPSKIPRGQKGYRGPIIFNPGGPGGSGVDFMQGRAKQFRALLGEDHDMVGFDPRGVGRTYPKIELFRSEAEVVEWDIRLESSTPLNSTPDALARAHAQSLVYSSLAAEREAHAGQYVSTALAARDMLRIVEAYGEHSINYWGFSYGSALGITFAAMFPDKIGRLVVDGVVDVEDYFTDRWSDEMRDSDAALNLFYQSCVEAGPEACALHDADAAKIHFRMEKVFKELQERPIAVPPQGKTTSLQSDYGVVDYGMVRVFVFFFLYAPYAGRTTSAASLAAALAAMEKRDGRPFWDLVKGMRATVRCNCGDGKPQDQRVHEPNMAISCSDKAFSDDSLEYLQARYERAAKVSSFAGLRGLFCSGWRIKPKEIFSGPFVGNTSFPILLIGNTADPVTPLSNARKMATGFKDAVVLHQKSVGHCSLSAASLCTAKVVRNYFRHGIVPEAGMECEVESRMFGGLVKTSGLDYEDQQLADAINELNLNFETPMMRR